MRTFRDTSDDLDPEPQMHLVRAVVTALLLGLLAHPSAARAQDAAVALVVGNTRYPDGDAPLTSAAEDAKALGTELQRRGYTVEIGENLTRRGLQEATDRLIARVRPGSTVVVAFTGYGIQSGRQNYLIPVDGQIWTEADVQRDGLGLIRLLSEVDRRGASATYVVLDGAYRNPFERRFRSFSTGLAPIASLPSSVSAIYSAAPGTVLKEPTTARSPFSSELVRQVEAAGGLSAAVFDRTRVALSQSSAGTQTPWVFSSVRTAPPVEAGAAPGTVDPSLSPGDAFRAAQRAGTRQAYESFLSRHGSGPFADLARLEMARLAPAVAAAPPAPPAAPPQTASRPPEAQRADIRPPEVKPPEPRQPEPRQPEIRPAENRPPEVPPAPPAAIAPPPAPPVKEANARPPELKPQEVKPQDSRPQVLPYSADDARLRADLTAAISKNPGDVVSLYTRGQLYALHRDFGLALADFDAVVKLQPKDVEALNNRCWVRAIQEEFDGALADCNAALKLRPNFLDALDSRGFVNLRIGLPRRALADYEAALKVNARHASALYGRGVARTRLGQAAEGRTDMTGALALDPAVAGDFASYGVR